MIPDGWRSATLGELVDETDGLQTGPFGSQLHAADYSRNGVPVVMPRDLSRGRITTDKIARVPETIAASMEKHRARPGDILLGRRGDIGRCGLVTDHENGWLCGTGCLRARPNRFVAASEFLIQAITWERSTKWLMENAVGQTMLNLNTEILRRLPFRAPPLPEQIKIAAILSSVDAAIEATEAVIEQLQVVKKAMMAELLRRGIPGRHKKFKMTEIGEVPEEWDVVPADSVCVAVIDCKNRTPPYVGAGYPVIRTPNVRDGRLVIQDLRLTDPDSYRQWTARGTPIPGDVVITREAPVGEACLIPAGMKPCLGQRMMLMRPEPGRLVPQFLLAALQAEGIQKHLELISGGSTVGHVRVGDIRALPVPVPEIDEQKTIAVLFESLSDRVEQERLVLKHLCFLKSYLMSVLLTGEVRVKPNEGAA